MSSLDSFVDGTCLVIAEVAQSHDGSLGTAHAFIDAAAEAGADAVKFQTHIADAESTPSEPWRVSFSTQDASRFEYWKRMEFSKAQWRELREHASDAGLFFASSPFSLQAVALLDEVEVDIFKIASGEVTNAPLLDEVAATKRPIVLSSGMSPWSEIDGAVDRLRTYETPLAVLQCTSEYPCPPERVGLNMIPELKRRYGLPVGLSDHSGTIFPGLGAAVLSIAALEVHLTLSRRMFGPDVPASITVEEMKTLVEGIRFIERTMQNPVDKDAMADDLSSLRRLFMRSPVTTRSLEAGHRLVTDDLALKKPGTGLPPDTLDSLIGRILARSVPGDHQISIEDLDTVE
jgi:N-acetylneuraminate synthase